MTPTISVRQLIQVADKMAHLLNVAGSRCDGEKDGSCWSCKRDAVLKELRKVKGYAD